MPDPQTFLIVAHGVFSGRPAKGTLGGQELDQALQAERIPCQLLELGRGSCAQPQGRLSFNGWLS